MNYVKSFGRELGIAAFEEAANMLPGIVCFTAATLTPVVGTIAQVATSVFSMKGAVEEVRKKSSWTLHRTANILYNIGVSALAANQALNPPSIAVNLALGGIAAGVGALKLWRGFQHMRKGLQDESSGPDVKIRAVAKGLVSTSVGLVSLRSGINRVIKSLPILKYKAKFSATRSKYLAIKYGLHLFDSTIHDSKVDERLANETLAIIQARATQGVSFSEEGMFPWNPLGTCSARALDFLARHQTECPLDATLAEQANCIDNFARYYEFRSPIFSSRQVAFDTIRVNKNMSDPEALKTSKMASLAALHNMVLTPMTEKSLEVDEHTNGLNEHFRCFNEKQIELFTRATYGAIGKKDLNSWEMCENSLYNLPRIPAAEQTIIDMINRLPFGRFLIRGIQPEDNHKQEYHGHSMAFVKSRQGNFFFNPSDGAWVILLDSGMDVAARILRENSWYSNFRIYKVLCGKGGCENIAPRAL